MIWVGWLLIAFGVVFVAMAVMAAYKEIQSRKTFERKDGDDQEGSYLRDLTEFIKVLGAQPRSLMFAILGLLLISFGAMVLQNPSWSPLQPFPSAPKAG